VKPRWLLLGLSVVCLLVLFPASALSQQGRAELYATCGTARVDGVKSPGEWDRAGVAGMFPAPPWLWDRMIADLGAEASHWQAPLGQQPATVEAWLYAMNDESHLYLAQLMNLDSIVTDPLYWGGIDKLVFLDEPPDALDEHWEAADCGPPRPGEGEYFIREVQLGGVHEAQESFTPRADPDIFCDEVVPIPGVNWAMGPGSLFVEWEMDLNASDVDKVGPGDCLGIATILRSEVCRQGSDCAIYSNLVEGGAVWPPLTLDVLPLGMLCLDPCQVEFVPEPGSVLLLGSGLIGLAGYAGLRWRTRQ